MVLYLDQGLSYIFGVFNKYLVSNGVKYSMLCLGIFGDNSFMESFWSYMKIEFFNFYYVLN